MSLDVAEEIITRATDSFDVVLTTDTPSYDMGYRPRIDIGDYVFLDHHAADEAEGNGVQDQSDAPVPNVNVQLYRVYDPSDLTQIFATAVGETVTDESGHYLFTDVEPGAYYLRFVITEQSINYLLDAGLMEPSWIISYVQSEENALANLDSNVSVFSQGVEQSVFNGETDVFMVESSTVSIDAGIVAADPNVLVDPTVTNMGSMSAGGQPSFMTILTLMMGIMITAASLRIIRR